jgi:hypothetical protein
MIPDTGTPRSARPGKSFRRSPAGAGLLQKAWLRLGSHSRDDLLELADEAGLAVVVRAHLVHELVPAVREPGYGEAPLRSAKVFGRSSVLLTLARVHDVQTEGAPQPRGLFGVRLIEGFRRLNGEVARVTQVVVGALVDDAGKTRGLLRIDREREQHR